ncbi:MAG: LLM class flavin-dependent oxidoreductase [Gammaproteobacteria bacterium]|nr:LLM class flavin-dependent oxidoreductase [Gammaproteobacteria bacterium]
MALKFSIGLQGSYPIRDYIAKAQKIERYGFDEIHVYDDLMFKPTWPILTLIGEHTERILVGPGIITPQIVHPCYHAGNLAELDELTGGRAVCGIARGAFWELLGIERQERPVAMVREAIALIRRLLAGDRTPFHGRCFTATEELFFRFQPLRPEVPIFIGTWGPQMCQLAGEIACGVKSDGLWNPDYVRIVRENVAIGAARAGRDPAAVEIIAGPLCSVSADRERAREAARRVLAVYLPYLHPMTEVAGIPAGEIRQVREAAAAGDFARGARAVSDRAVRYCSVTGRPEDVIPQIEAMAAAGVTHVAFGHPLGPDFDEALDLLGREVLPHFRGRA